MKPIHCTGCVAGLLITKMKFYFAWSISDAACNVAGFGYKRPDWDVEEEELKMVSEELRFLEQSMRFLFTGVNFSMQLPEDDHSKGRSNENWNNAQNSVRKPF